jgi:DNA-binding CsgD family transcriptional regulator
MQNRYAAPARRVGLLGRASECAVLDDFASAIRGGKSRSLVLLGEAGIGKTALLGYVVEAAPDLTVLRAVGVESEMELAFASLHQLCGPLLDRLQTLPAPQRDALQVAFGSHAGPPPDRFLVGLGVLSLLSETADEHPLLCLVDDAQWLDRASAQTLAFVTRRLLAEPVGILFAARDPGTELQHISQLEVRGVTNGDARVLLDSAVRFKLDDRVRDRIIAETRGNPLALLELPRELTPTQLAGGFGLLESQALPDRIEQSFVRRLQALSDDARRLLLVAAAEPIGDPLLLWRAAERLGIPRAAADGARAQGLVAIGERVTFWHPLVRSGVYRSARIAERRAAHSALAEATDREADPDRRAWHLAAAAEGPDEEVAAELERSADRAQARGGLAAAAAFLQRAVALTEDATRRAERALAAAQASYQAGEFDSALGLLATAEDGPLDEFQRARAELVRGQVAFASFGADAAWVLLKAARRLEPFDLELARETYLMAWGSAAHVAGGGPLLEICRAILALPPPAGAPRPIHLLLDGLALLSTGDRGAATSVLKQAANALADIPVEDVLRWGWVAPAASAAVWDFEGLLAISARQVQVVRQAGALGALLWHLSVLGLVRMWMGDFAGAAALVAESDTVSAATGSFYAPYTTVRLRALEGSEAEACEAIASAIDQTAEGQGMAAPWAHLASAELYNGLARYEQAKAAARQAAASTFDPWNSSWALPELVEAAARTGDTELARDALGRLTQTTQPSGTDLALGIEARSRALLSEGKAADDWYREAIERLGRSRLRTELARAHLLYGEWLRREGRRVDARQQLRHAYDAFIAMGAEAFAERARRELLATGEKLRTRRDETGDELTPQEEQIARLARDGLTNREIAAELFLSTRTVEWHLQKVFGKLGIKSRTALHDALPDANRPPERDGDQ